MAEAQMEEDKWFLSYLSHTQTGARTCLKAAGRYRQASSPERLRLCMENVQVWLAGGDDNESLEQISRFQFEEQVSPGFSPLTHFWFTNISIF